MKNNTITKLMGAVLLVFTSSIGYGQCSDLIFNDDFDGSSVDLSKWQFDNGDGCPTLCGWGNAEEQWYQPQNTTIVDGKLVITTKFEAAGGKQYTSSKLITSGKFTSRYGRYEASIKLPSAGGVWPAFWMLPENGSWPFTGEIDIMEAQQRNPESVSGTVHYSNGGWRFTGREYSAGEDLSAGFHVYAVEWEPTEIRWYVDDVLYHSVTPSNTVDPWPFAKGDWYLILNVAVGGPGTPFTGNTPPTPADYPTQMEVDYVRVYNGSFSNQIVGDTKVTEGEQGVTYSITTEDNATYNWSVPQGATIASGQGTNAIRVNWGTTDGNIELTVTSADCGEKEYSLNVDVSAPKTVDFVFEDYENSRNVRYGASTTGVLLQQVANPENNSVNGSASVGKYERNASESYDVLFMQSDDIGNALEFISGTRSIFVDVYTDAPIGTEVLVQLENSVLSTGDFPQGRQSRYNAFTTKRNEWQTLEFEYFDRPDAAVGAFDANQLAVLIDPNSNTAHTTYIDNIRSMKAPDVSLIGEEVIADFDQVNQLEEILVNGEYEANSANPRPNSVNNSSVVAKYTRNPTETYDVISFATGAIENAEPFKRQDNIFYMDVYTSSPVGTEILISLENETLSEEEFPLGINSQYTAVISKQNEWHTVAFAFTGAPDVGTSNISVNEISILFDSGSNSSGTYYFDNFKYGITKVPDTYSDLDVIQNYDGITNLTLNNTTTGTYSTTANPASNAVNNSANTARYTRNVEEQYDVLFFNTNAIKDASEFVAEEKRFAMDIYTSAPVGTVVSWQLENGQVSNPENYPLGRHSVYQGAITEQNEWHTVEFVLVNTPDLVVSDEDIDTVVLLFDPGTFSGETFYFDNMRTLKKDATVETPILTTITVSSEATEINKDATLQFTANGFDQLGGNFATEVIWTTTGGTIDTSGLFQATSVGIFTITATSGAVSGSKEITVITPTVDANYTSLPGVIEAEDYKEGGQGIGYNDTTPGNLGGAYREDAVDIQNTGDTSGTYNVGWINAGEWLAYDVDATATGGRYTAEFRVASPDGLGSFHLEANGQSITEVITVPNTGNWQNYTTVVVEDVLLTQGKQEIRVVFDSRSLNFNYIEFKASTGTEITEPSTCSGKASNGQYSYEISKNEGEIFLNFKPEVVGVGERVCILYYGTEENGLYPGYIVTPNKPFAISAAQGEIIYFYYTYSLPSGGENNTSKDRDSFTIGECSGNKNGSSPLFSDLKVFPNPVADVITLSGIDQATQLEVFTVKGERVLSSVLQDNTQRMNLNVAGLVNGLYYIKVHSENVGVKTLKFIKN